MGGHPDPDNNPYPGWAYAEPPPHEHHKGGQPKWLPQAQRTGKYIKLVGCTLQVEGKEPLAVAKRWSELYRVPLVEKHEDGGVPAVLFSNCVLRFVKARDGKGDGMQRWVFSAGTGHPFELLGVTNPPFSTHSIDLLVPSRAAAQARALNVDGAVMGPNGEVKLVGVWWRFKEEGEVDSRITRNGGWIESGVKKTGGKL